LTLPFFPQAAIAEVLCKLFTVLDGLQVILKIDADPVSHRDAILHIEAIIAQQIAPQPPKFI
jgi:hypothetical protein